MALSEVHAGQCASFARMTSQRTLQHVKELEILIDDFSDDNTPSGEMYNVDDVRRLFQSLKEEVGKVAHREFTNAFLLSTAMVKQLLLAAERKNAELYVDIARLESVDVLNDAADIHQMTSKLPARGLAPMASLNIQALPGLKVPAFSTPGPPQPLTNSEEMDSMKEKLKAMSDRSTEVMREKTALNKEIDMLRQEIRDMQGQAHNADLIQAVADARVQHIEASTASSELQISELKDANERLRSELDELKLQVRIANEAAEGASEKAKMRILEAAKAEEGFNQRLSESKQVQQLMDMMKKKSQQVVELQTKLNQYEGDAVPNADD